MVTDMESLLTKEDVCRILGVKESWLNTEIKEGRMPHIRLGKKKFVRFRPEHIQQYLDTKEHGANGDERNGEPE
jgi:excisionase family DNA binding protein